MQYIFNNWRNSIVIDKIKETNRSVSSIYYNNVLFFVIYFFINVLLTQDRPEGPVAEAVVDVKEGNVNDARETVYKSMTDEDVVEGCPLAAIAHGEPNEQEVEYNAAGYYDQLAYGVQRRLQEEIAVAVEELVPVGDEVRRCTIVEQALRSWCRLIRLIATRNIHYSCITTCRQWFLCCDRVLSDVVLRLAPI